MNQASARAPAQAGSPEEAHERRPDLLIGHFAAG